jgi:hypothetical protein
MVSELRTGRQGFNSQQRHDSVFLPPRPEWLWSPPSLLSKWVPGRESDYPRLTWSYIFTPPYVFMAWYLVKHRDNFALKIFEWRKGEVFGKVPHSHIRHVPQKTPTFAFASNRYPVTAGVSRTPTAGRLGRTCYVILHGSWAICNGSRQFKCFRATEFHPQMQL